MSGIWPITSFDVFYYKLKQIHELKIYKKMYVNLFRFYIYTFFVLFLYFLIFVSSKIIFSQFRMISNVVRL